MTDAARGLWIVKASKAGETTIDILNSVFEPWFLNSFIYLSKKSEKEKNVINTVSEFVWMKKKSSK